MNILNFILAQQGAGAQGSGMSGIFMIVAMIVIFYFFMIRPQQREALTKGDKVVTAGGIHGKITADKGTYFMVEIAPGTTIRVEKTSIYPLEEAPAKKEEKKEDKKAKEETPALEDNKD